MVTQDHIQTGTSGKGIVSRSSENEVVSAPTINRVVAAVDGIDSLKAHDYTGSYCDNPPISENYVISRLTVELIISGLAIDQVVACSPIDLIVAADGRIDIHIHDRNGKCAGIARFDGTVVSEEYISRFVAVERIVSGSTEKVVGRTSTGQHIVPADRIRALDLQNNITAAPGNQAVITDENIGIGITGDRIPTAAPNQYIDTSVSKDGVTPAHRGIGRVNAAAILVIGYTAIPKDNIIVFISSEMIIAGTTKDIVDT